MINKRVVFLHKTRVNNLRPVDGLASVAVYPLCTLCSLYCTASGVFVLATAPEQDQPLLCHSVIPLAFVLFRARPMYRHTDIYRPIWRCIVSTKFRRYISAIFADKSVALLLCMERSETSCYFVSDPDWLTQMLCPVPSEQSLRVYRPLCNSPDKTFHDVTLARRFWRGKQMIVCKQTRLRVFVLVGCFTTGATPSVFPLNLVFFHFI